MIGAGGPTDGPYRLRPLELACGSVLGLHPDTHPLQPAQTTLSTRDALEAAVVPALSRPPCLISFSGGRDSSAVLAVAAWAARRHALDSPVPVTLRFPDAPRSEESTWQELVVSHLGLEDWIKLEFREELDVVGPVARDVLGRHGHLWPANIHAHQPMLAAARGGSLLTGFGGDELFATPWPLAVTAAMLTHPRKLMSRAHLRYAARGLAPPLARRRLPGHTLNVPWMHAGALTRARHEQFESERVQPQRYDRFLREWFWRSRALHIVRWGLAAIASSCGTAIGHPLVDPGFIDALAVDAGWKGFVGRTAAMKHLFGDLLPLPVLSRSSKAGFGRAFFGTAARDFATTWSGEGVDGTIVDVDRLRETWLAPDPDGRSMSLLQAAFLASSSG